MELAGRAYINFSRCKGRESDATVCPWHMGVWGHAPPGDFWNFNCLGSFLIHFTNHACTYNVDICVPRLGRQWDCVQARAHNSTISILKCFFLFAFHRSWSDSSWWQSKNMRNALCKRKRKHVATGRIMAKNSKGYQCFIQNHDFWDGKVGGMMLLGWELKYI